MTVQLLLTTVFGFGGLTLAAAALLNTAGHRIYELQRTNAEVNPGDDLFFEYTYVTNNAESLRSAFTNLPRRLGIAAFSAIAFVGALYYLAMAQPYLNEEEVEYSQVLSVVMLTTLSVYTVVLLAVVGSLIRRLFKVMQEFDRVPRSHAASGGMAGGPLV